MENNETWRERLFKKFGGDIINDGENEPYIVLPAQRNKSVEGSQMYSVDGLIDEFAEFMSAELLSLADKIGAEKGGIDPRDEHGAAYDTGKNDGLDTAISIIKEMAK